MAEKTYFENISGKPEEHISLAEGALNIAMDEYPALNIDSYLKLLGSWSRRLKRDFVRYPSHVRMERLNDWLFGVMNFSGNQDNYYDPKNSFLNEVIDRRTGIPITLSVIYLELAWAVGLEASGVGFPGHFLVRVMAEGKPLYVDAFNKGKIMTSDGCMRFLEELTEGELEFDKNFLTTANKRDILARMLRNLKRIYLESNNFTKLVRVLDHLVILNPDVPEELRDRGIIHYQLKAFGLAQQDFETFLSLSSDTEDAEVIHQYLEILREYRSHMN